MKKPKYIWLFARLIVPLQNEKIIMKQDQIVIYKDDNNAIQLEVRMDGEMIWLTRQQLATLFGRDYKTIRPSVSTSTMPSGRNWPMKW